MIAPWAAPDKDLRNRRFRRLGSGRLGDRKTLTVRREAPTSAVSTFGSQRP